jgi:hypothetical protein
MRDVRRALAVPLAQEVRQRVAVVRRRRVHREPRGLVDDGEDRVLVDHTELARRVGLAEALAHEAHDLARMHTLPRRAGASVLAPGTRLDDLPRALAAQPRDAPLEEAIEALTLQLTGHAEREDDGVVLARLVADVRGAPARLARPRRLGARRHGGHLPAAQAALVILFERMQRVQTRACVGEPSSTMCTGWRFGSCHLRDLRFE